MEGTPKKRKIDEILSCFRNAGFPAGNPTDLQEDPDEDDDNIPLSELLHVARQYVDGSEMKTFADMDAIEAELPIEETYDGEWEKTLVEQFKKHDEIADYSDRDADEIEDNESDVYSYRVLLYVRGYA